MKIPSTAFLIYQVALIILSWPLCSHAHWKKVFFADIGYGEVNGFSQTPKGGSVGTTSFRRPTFEEADIQSSFINDWGAGLEYNGTLAILRYQPLHAKGNTLLKSDLLTHTKFLPSGSPFTMQVKYDWYAIMIAKDLYFHHKQWILSPEIQGNWIKYHYAFSGAHHSKRAFTLATLSAGLKIQHHFYAKLWFEASYQHSLPLNQVTLTQAYFGFHMPLKMSSLTIIPKIGLGYLQIQYQDKQLVPNDIRYTQNPYGMIGVTFLV